MPGTLEHWDKQMNSQDMARGRQNRRSAFIFSATQFLQSPSSILLDKPNVGQGGLDRRLRPSVATWEVTLSA